MNMLVIASGLSEAVSKSLKDETRSPEGLIPVAGVSGHYCSLKEENLPSFKYLFPLEIEGRKVFVYHKF